MSSDPPTMFMVIADPQVGMTQAFSRMPLAAQDHVQKLFERAGMLPRSGRLRIPRGPVNLDIDIARVSAAIDAALSLRPQFVLVCGDLVNNIDQPEQGRRLREQFARLPADIPVMCVPGNHDLSTNFHNPTADALSEYRAKFGPDCHAFRAGTDYFVALNSEVLHEPEALAEEAKRQFEFVCDSLHSQDAQTARRRTVFMHTPIATGHRLIDASANVMSEKFSKSLVEIFEAQGVSHVFSGHLHQNRRTQLGGIEYITVAALGMPVVGTSGYTIVDEHRDSLRSTFVPLEASLR